MSKRTTFTTISPLPLTISRQVVLDFLHNHEEMIDLNPLVKERHRIDPPSHATADEQFCIWYSLTDKISYLPGGLADGDVTYTCAFNNLLNGLQTHCYAPAGLNIRSKWTLNGSLPGEPTQPVELGINAPLSGLYIREDVDMRCNVVMASFVKKTLKKSHASLINRLKVKAQMASVAEKNTLRVSRLLPETASVHSNHSCTYNSCNSCNNCNTCNTSNTCNACSYSNYSYSQPWAPSPSAQSDASQSWISIPSVHRDASPPWVSPVSTYSTTDQSWKSSSPVPSTTPSYLPFNSSSVPLSLRPGRASAQPVYPPYYRNPYSLSSDPSLSFHIQQHPPPPYQQLPSQSSQYYYQKNSEQNLHFSQPFSEYQPVSNIVSPDDETFNPELIPDPLRIQRRDSPTSAYPDEDGDLPPWQMLRHGPSVRYRESHPDYPQLNPYTADEKTESITTTAAPVLVPVSMDGTLNAPWVAELE